MRLLTRAAFAACFALFTGVAAAIVEIPAYVPNVVDSGQLSASERNEVNAALQWISNQDHIWGAVLILPSLDDEAIESVAVRAFEKWGLGAKGIDNGLLLVLAMKERQARFEVGYGLEGFLPDAVARRVLDEQLVPKLRAGRLAEGITSAFGAMARQVAADQAAVDYLRNTPAAVYIDPDPHADLRAIAAGSGPALAIICAGFARRRYRKRRCAELLRQDPTLSFDDEDVVNSGERPAKSAGPLLFVVGVMVLPIIAAVMAVNGAYNAPWIVTVLWAITPWLLQVSVIRLALTRYKSPDHYRRFQDRLALRREKLLRKGSIEWVGPGKYAYSEAYLRFRRTSTEHSTRQPSDPFDYSPRSASGGEGSVRPGSSAGGGRSGGGGANSNW